MNKAVLKPRRPNNIGSLLEPAWDIGDSHHVLDHHRANVIAPGQQRQRICGKGEGGAECRSLFLAGQAFELEAIEAMSAAFVAT